MMPPRTSQQEDESAVRRVLAGDRDHFRELVTAYQHQVFGMIMRQVADETTARDLAQEVFVRAFHGLRSFRFDSSFGTWITRIALNVCRSYYTSRAFRDRSRLVSLSESGAAERIAVDSSAVETERELHRLRQLIWTLKPIYRDVVVLYSLEGKSYEEISEILAIPMGTVASRMNTATALLRKKFFSAAR